MTDINHFIKSGLLSYADNTKIWMSTKNSEELQLELDKICRWIEENSILLNGKKFEHLSIGKRGEHNIQGVSKKVRPLPRSNGSTLG